MIVADFRDLIGTDRDVKDPDGQWTSLRQFLAKDGLGYSFHKTTIEPNAVLHMEYKNHVELVSIIQGEGEITDEKTGKIYPLKPGVTYLLNDNDAHILRAGADGLVAHCIFTPAVTGDEVHGEDGAYPAPPSEG